MTKKEAHPKTPDEIFHERETDVGKMISDYRNRAALVVHTPPAPKPADK